MDTIDARIGLHLDTGKGSLRHWKVAIGQAYAGFQSNFLGLEHHSFAALVVSVDGREAGSTFPNFTDARERERWGV